MMIYKTIELLSRRADKMKTEIMYEVASAHAAGIELVRFNIAKGEEDSTYRRALSSATKILKDMKQSDTIRFFATHASLAQMNTEASFLINKYPDIFDTVPEETDEYGFIYVRV